MHALGVSPGQGIYATVQTAAARPPAPLPTGIAGQRFDVQATPIVVSSKRPKPVTWASNAGSWLPKNAWNQSQLNVDPKKKKKTGEETQQAPPAPAAAENVAEPAPKRQHKAATELILPPGFEVGKEQIGAVSKTATGARSVRPVVDVVYPPDQAP